LVLVTLECTQQLNFGACGRFFNSLLFRLKLFFEKPPRCSEHHYNHPSDFFFFFFFLECCFRVLSFRRGRCECVQLILNGCGFSFLFFFILFFFYLFFFRCMLKFSREITEITGNEIKSILGDCEASSEEERCEYFVFFFVLCCFFFFKV